MSSLDSVIAELESIAGEKSLDIALRDPYFFLTNLCYTMDEHDTTGNPFHLFPEKEYLRDLCDLFMSEDLLAVEKSRQMLVSWWAMGIALWYTMFNPGKRTFIMSKKEEDANAMIERIKVMYERLPKEIRDAYPADRPFTYTALKFGKTNSIIKGIPQGPDQVRQYTASLVIMDEAAFQEQSERAYNALKPALMGGGKVIVISTANGRNWFYRLVRDAF